MRKCVVSARLKFNWFYNCFVISSVTIFVQINSNTWFSSKMRSWKTIKQLSERSSTQLNFNFICRKLVRKWSSLSKITFRSFFVAELLNLWSYYLWQGCPYFMALRCQQMFLCTKFVLWRWISQIQFVKI